MNHDQQTSSASKTTRDPVCGMTVDPATAKNRAEHAGSSFFFCCAGCKTKFLASPERYLNPSSDAPAPAAHATQAAHPAPSAPPARGTVYTCPMHPEIRRSEHGSCPLCGMALEPEGIPEAAGTSPELKDMTRRFVIGAVLAAPVFVLDMSGRLTGGFALGPVGVRDTRRAVVRVALLPAGLRFGPQPLAQYVHLDRPGVARPTSIAWSRPSHRDSSPPAFEAHGGLVPVYYEAAAVITVLVLLGQVLELRAREKTGGAIRALLALAPKTARRLAIDGTDEEVPIDRST